MMINILEILKKIPNLEDMVFYSPLYGDVKVEIIKNTSYPIGITDHNSYEQLNIYGLISNFSKGEPMLYPSRQNRDWSTFEIPRKDLPKDTSVMVTDFPPNGWNLKEYAGNAKCYSPCDKSFFVPWKYIIPVDKFNFNNWTFKEEDNYGTSHNE